MTCNAKLEFLELLENHETENCKLVAAQVNCEDETAQETGLCILYKDHTPAERELFLEKLNYCYDSSYGTQYLFGTVWFSDGSWADRAEYDGQEWWRYNSRPPLPIKE